MIHQLPVAVDDAVTQTNRARTALNDALIAVDRSPSGVAWEELSCAAAAFMLASETIVEAVEGARKHHAMADVEEAS